MSDPIAKRASNKACVDRYRQRNRRIDYVPAPRILALIEDYKAQGLNNCLSGVIDDLVRAGHKAISGNGALRG